MTNTKYPLYVLVDETGAPYMQPTPDGDCEPFTSSSKTALEERYADIIESCGYHVREASIEVLDQL